MWFLPRVSALGAIVIVTGAFLILVLDLDLVGYVLSGIVSAVLLLAIVFDWYEGPKK